MVGQLVEDEGFEFVPVRGIFGAEVEGGELIGKGGLVRGVCHLLVEEFDIVLQDPVVLGLLLVVLAEGGTDGHEGIEAEVEVLVIDDDVTEAVEIVQLLVFLRQEVCCRGFLVHPATEDGDETGFYAVDEACIENEGFLFWKGHEVGCTVMDVDVLVVGEEFDGDAETNAFPFEMHIVYLSFETFELSFTHRHLDAIADVGVLGAELKFLAIFQTAIHEPPHHIITDGYLLTFSITVMPKMDVTKIPGLTTDLLKSRGSHLQEHEFAYTASQLVASAVFVLPVPNDVRDALVIINTTRHLTPFDGQRRDERVGDLVLCSMLHICIVFVQIGFDLFRLSAGHDEPLKLVFFACCCSHIDTPSFLCPMA